MDRAEALQKQLARELGIDYIYMGPAEQRANPAAALAKFRKTTQPLGDFTPKGIFPKYEEARDRVVAEADGAELRGRDDPMLAP